LERIVGPEPGSAAFLVFLPVNIGFLVVIPLGFILLGFGLPRPSRTMPLVVGCYLLAAKVVPISTIVPPAAMLVGTRLRPSCGESDWQPSGS
jgi:hypothetical protein